MAIFQAFSGAIGGTFADQWKDIITAGQFDEYVAVAPGIFQESNNGRGTNFKGSVGVISNGSKIFVPENTAAFIFSQSGIETIITQPGGYEYQDGQSSIFNGDGIKESFVSQIATRVGYGGQTSDQKQVAFVNLREIRGIKFGTRGPLVYNDLFYGTDLEIKAFGSFSLRVVDPVLFIRNFVPPNVSYYSFSIPQVRQQLLSEFIQSFTVSLNSLSSTHRISQLPSQAHAIVEQMRNRTVGSGTWASRFGIEIVNIGVENIEFTPESRELVKQYSSNLMNLKAYEGISQQASSISAQQKIAQGVQDYGFGDGGGMLFGMNLAQGLNPQNAAGPVLPAADIQSATARMSFDEQVEAVKKMKELLDAGLLSEAEFATKKKEIMGL